MNIILFLILITLLSLINFFLVKSKKFIHINVKNEHKKFGLNKIPLSGGLFFVISFFFISLLNNFTYLNFVLYGSVFLILGFFSDRNLKISAQQRLAIMLILSFLIIINAQLFIDKVDIVFLDKFLKINILSIIFFAVCLVILINGVNFIDGTNGNAIGYFIICFISLIYQLGFFENTQNELKTLKIMLCPMIAFFLLNLFNKNYLGDNGSYLMASVTGILCINCFIYYNISSFYFINLLLYPVFEVLVSFIRKIQSNKSPYSPDNLHLHHLIEKNLSQFKLLKKYKNNLSTFVILFLLTIFFVLINLNINDKLFQLNLTSVFCIFYLFIYLILRILLSSKKLR